MNKFTLTQLRNDTKIQLNKQVKITNLNLTTRINLVDDLVESLIGDNYYLTLHLHPYATIEFKESKQNLDFGHYMHEDGRRF